jgi:hypothetical protein
MPAGIPPVAKERISSEEKSGRLNSGTIGGDSEEGRGKST